MERVKERNEEKAGHFITDRKESEAEVVPGRPPVIVACSPCVTTSE